MKYVAALIALLFTVTAFADEAAPPVSARQALDSAEKDMNERGLGKQVFVESVTLMRPPIFGGETFWFIKWSHPIPASAPGTREYGIKVRMDGRTTRLVKKVGQP